MKISDFIKEADILMSQLGLDGEEMDDNREMVVNTLATVAAAAAEEGLEQGKSLALKLAKEDMYRIGFEDGRQQGMADSRDIANKLDGMGMKLPPKNEDDRPFAEGFNKAVELLKEDLKGELE